MAGGSTGNVYAGCLDEDLFTKTPKAVFAAIAVSLLSAGGDRLDSDKFDLNQAMLDEWTTLHSNGIVPQKPPKQKGA